MLEYYCHWIVVLYEICCNHTVFMGEQVYKKFLQTTPDCGVLFTLLLYLYFLSKGLMLLLFAHFLLVQRSLPVCCTCWYRLHVGIISSVPLWEESSELFYVLGASGCWYLLCSVLLILCGGLFYLASPVTAEKLVVNLFWEALTLPTMQPPSTMWMWFMIMIGCSG